MTDVDTQPALLSTDRRSKKKGPTPDADALSFATHEPTAHLGLRDNVGLAHKTSHWQGTVGTAGFCPIPGGRVARAV